MLIFSLHKMKYIWYFPKKVTILFIYILKGELQKAVPKSYLVISHHIEFFQCFFFYNNAGV